MGKCSECHTRFRFSDVLKAINPASIKCSGCSNRIESSYLTLLLFLTIFILFTFALLSLSLNNSSSTALSKIIFLFVIAFKFEYAYFKFLSSGKIKSNLFISD